MEIQECRATLRCRESSTCARLRRLLTQPRGLQRLASRNRSRKASRKASREQQDSRQRQPRRVEWRKRSRELPEFADSQLIHN